MADIKDLKRQALDLLNKRLAELAAKYPTATNNANDTTTLLEETAAAIDSCLQQVFAKVETPQEKVILYKELALVFQVLHIKSNDSVFTPDVKAYLEREELTANPLEGGFLYQILKLYNNSTLLRDSSFLNRWGAVIKSGVTTELQDEIKKDPSKKDPRQKLAINEMAAKQAFAGHRYVSMVNLSRYPALFAFFAIVIYLVTIVAIAIIWKLVELFLYVSQNLIPSGLYWLCNLHTAGIYEQIASADYQTKIKQEEDSYLAGLKVADDKANLLEVEYISALKKDYGKINEFVVDSTLSDANFKNIYITTPARDSYLSKFGIFDLAKNTSSAMWQVLTRPLPADNWGKLWAIVTWPVRLLTALPLLSLLIVARVILAIIANVVLPLAYIGILTVLSAVSLALNTPLLLLDAVSYLASAVISKPKLADASQGQSSTFGNLMRPDSELNNAAVNNDNIQPDHNLPAPGSTADDHANPTSGSSSPQPQQEGSNPNRRQDEDDSDGDEQGCCFTR